MKLLLYCTKAKPNLWKYGENFLKYLRTLDVPVTKFELGNKVSKKNPTYKYCEPYIDEVVNLNGKIVAECDFEVEKIMPIDISEDDYNYGLYSGKNLLKDSCLDNDDICEYLKDYDGETIFKSGYAIHIKNLHIFDEPRELSDYEDEWEYPLEKAPQNMRRCYSTLYSNIEADMPIRTDSYILISIQPRWLCKILNGEKTIEVRKKVLKEMLG